MFISIIRFIFLYSYFHVFTFTCCFQYENKNENDSCSDTEKRSVLRTTNDINKDKNAMDKTTKAKTDIEKKNEGEDKYNLRRFIDAHKKNYERAYEEINRKHKKESCWIWYIFPQIDGLGKSTIAKLYAFKSLNEVIEFLRNSILRENLIKITKSLIKIKDENKNIKILDIMSSDLDVTKLKSSMTLFDYVLKKYSDELKDIYSLFVHSEAKNIFEEVLDVFYEGKKDTETVKKIDILTD